MKSLVTFPLALLFMAVSWNASAAVCIQIDEKRDNLEPAERTAILTMVENAARRQGLRLAQEDAACDEIYTIFSVRLGSTLTATLLGPDDLKSQKARDLDALPEVYEQLLSSMLDDKRRKQDDAAAASAAATRQQGVAEPTSPGDTRAPAANQSRSLETNIWFARLGYIMDFGIEFGGGPAIGVGYRYEASDFGLEISALNLNMASIDSFADALSASWIRLGGLYFFTPDGNRSPYLQAGMSWGSNFVTASDEMQGASGIRGEFGGGMEFLRESPVRLFVEGNVVLPFYSVKYQVTQKTPTPPTPGSNDDPIKTDHKIYTPAVMIYMGIGF